MKKLVMILLVLAMFGTAIACNGETTTTTVAPVVDETDPPADVTDPPVDETDPPVDETDPPVEETDPPEVDPGTTEGSVAGKTFALLVKSAGNPYNEKEAEGFTRAVEEFGGEVVVKQPEKASAEDQITMIGELVAQRVDAIAIAGNDFDALQPALTQAKDAGIKVLSLDSAVNADSRLVHVNQAGTDLIGQALVDAVFDLSGGSGQFAILSATSQASNQNAWIASMRTILEDEKYADMELVEVAYGDDEYQKSVDQTQALLKNFPDLKVICAPTTVGIMAAGKVLKDENSDVLLTGLGLPSEMAEYIGEGEGFPTPYMYLWNPIDIGYLAGYTAKALVEGTVTGAEGDQFQAGELGDYTIVAAGDGGTEVILGPPFKFDPSNIDEWKEVY